MRRACLFPVLAACLSCNGTTGYELVNFYAAARGPGDAVKGQPYTFQLDARQRVTLTKATLHIGALYLTQSVPQSGGGPAPCVLPGTYDGVFVGEVLGGGDVDLLDPSLQTLPVGQGSTIPAATGQVWLTHGDVNAPVDPSAIVHLEGLVVADGATISFSGGIALDETASSSTGGASTNSGLPGANQICQVRIVQGIPAELTLAQAGTLVLVVDPKALLTNANFGTEPGAVELSGNATSQTNQPSSNLFDNLKGTGPYRFEWIPPSP
jgi:hypothetical protein